MAYGGTARLARKMPLPAKLTGGLIGHEPTDSNQQELQATPVNGGATTTIAISSMPITQIVANGEAIYWLEFGTPGTSMSAIRSIPGAGGTATTLFAGFDTDAGTFALDSSNVYYTTPDGTNAVDLVSRPLAGGAPTTLVSSLLIRITSISWIQLTKIFDGHPSNYFRPSRLSPSARSFVAASDRFWRLLGNAWITSDSTCRQS
jgi:hypothetical protein